MTRTPTGHSQADIDRWRFRGHHRPPFAREPAPGQESVWDYPRPPAVRPDSRRVQVRYRDRIIADTRAAHRVLETASPPTFYIPPGDVDMSCLRENDATSYCEWKGEARYRDFHCADTRIRDVAWTYPEPHPDFEAIRGHLCFYPGTLDCYVDGIRVEAQTSGYYGGWITPEIVGPFKGETGTENW